MRSEAPLIIYSDVPLLYLISARSITPVALWILSCSDVMFFLTELCSVVYFCEKKLISSCLISSGGLLMNLDTIFFSSIFSLILFSGKLYFLFLIFTMLLYSVLLKTDCYYMLCQTVLV